MPKLLITGATLITLDASLTVHPCGWLAIEGGRISALGEGEPPAGAVGDTVIDARGMIALPGLINGHTHFSQILVRGLGDGLPLMDWLRSVIWPLEAALTPQEMYLAARLSIAEQLRNGATTIVQHHKIIRSPEHIEAALRAAEELGVRLQLNRLWADIGPNGQQVHAVLAEMDDLRGWHGAGEGRITLGFGPTMPGRCSDAGMAALIPQARSWGLPVHMHIAETQGEVDQLLGRTGKRHVEWLDSLGALGPDMSLVHSVWLSDAELDRVAATGSPVVHCPVSNLYLGSGIAPVRKMLDRGITVGIGTDGAAAGGSQDMLQTARTAAFLARVQAGDPSALPAARALAMATAGGAGLVAPLPASRPPRGPLGVLSPGAAADVVILRAETFGAAGAADPYSAALYGTDGHDVHTVLVNGRIVLRDGRLPGVDHEQLLRTAGKAVAALRQRLYE